MIEHTYTECAEINFSKLEERVMAVNDPYLNKANDMREMLYQLAIDNQPTLIMATGGSKVVAYYLQSIIERMGFTGIITEVIEPRDYFYKHNVTQFKNLIVISSSGDTNGIKKALIDFKGNKFLITEKDNDLDCQVVSWSNEKYDKEKSFISLASSLSPMALMLDVTTSLNLEIVPNEIKKINEKIKEVMSKASNKINNLSIDFKNISLVQIMSGYDTKCASTVLESNLTEIGLAASVVHDKGSFCHGRSNLLFQYPDSYLNYLSHKETELDNLLMSTLSENYPNILFFDTKDLDENYFFKEYYLVLQMFYLSKKMAEDKNIDLTKPEYNPDVIKKVYKYRGEM